jgi:hypothetical protein
LRTSMCQSCSAGRGERICEYRLDSPALCPLLHAVSAIRACDPRQSARSRDVIAAIWARRRSAPAAIRMDTTHNTLQTSGKGGHEEGVLRVL